jgi:Zn-dependent oligopeptidases
MLTNVSAANPLLHLNFPLPFDAVTPAHVRPGFEALLAAMRQRVEEIAGAPRPDWNRLMAALDRGTEPLDLAAAVVSHLESVATTPALREAWNEIQPTVVEFYSGIPLHEGLWTALQNYAATPERCL